MSIKTSQKMSCLLFALMVSLSVSFSSSLFAGEVHATHLNLFFHKKNSYEYKRKGKYAVKPIWAKACKRLFLSMKAYRGAYGSGFFTSYSCYIDDMLVSGKKVSSKWSLNITDKETHVDVNLVFDDILQAKYRMFASPVTLKLLARKSFSKLLGYHLLGQLPMLGLLNDKQIQAGRLVVRRAPFGAKIKPSRELYLYHLTYNSKVKKWIPKVVGTAFLRKDKNNPKEKKKIFSKKSALKKKKVKTKPMVWDIKWTHGPPLKKERKKIVWFHSQKLERGLYSRRQLYDAFDKLYPSFVKRESFVEKVNNTTLKNYASSYAGVRYGKQVFSGNEILKDSYFIGVFAESRGGLLNGLQLYYDFAPKTEARVEDKHVELSWSRLNVGYGFSIQTDFFINRLEFMPKIGVWNFDMTLPVYLSTGSLITKSFKLKNRPCFAFEGRAEILSSWYTLRAWAAYDAALRLGALDLSSIESIRYGIDTFFHSGYKFELFKKPYNMNFMAFVLFESVKLSSSEKGSETEVFSVKEVSYENAYLGLGAAISWK